MSKDFSQGSMTRNILQQAVPLAVAQLVHILYNIVDRMYLGHMGSSGAIALSGIGITLPVVSLVAACTNLIGSGAVPIFSIACGAKDEQRADRTLGNAFTLLLALSLILMLGIYLSVRPLLFLFGASETSFPVASKYLHIYLAGTPFAMLSTGLNGFINAQGFPVVGMATTVIGAALNLILDPIFIYVLDMGVEGAALATILSQFVSCCWVLGYLFRGRRIAFHLHLSAMKPRLSLDREIASLGFSGFIMQATNGLVSAATTSQLQAYAALGLGDLYVSAYTVICSIREIVQMPVSGLTSGAQPVLGYNFGASKYTRVRQGIRMITKVGAAYTGALWVLILARPDWLIHLFSSDAELTGIASVCVRQFFAAFVFMTFQLAGQIVFQGLGFARFAIFFSLLRKVIIEVPLIYLMPRVGFGVSGVFLAEPVSDVLGGSACYLTMMLIIYRKLKETPDGMRWQR